MKLCRFDDQRIGVVDVADDAVYEITDIVAQFAAETTLGAFDDPLVAVIPALTQLAPADVKRRWPRALGSVALLSPVARPSKILAAPDNYRAHLEEMRKNQAPGGRQPSTLLKDGLFLKATSSIAGPAQGVDVRFPDRRTDHEIELVAVMGANGAIAGYTIGLDITLRGTEERSLRKSIDGYSVAGPWLVTADELTDPATVELTLRVNDTVRQNTPCADMLSDVATLVAYAAQFYTLNAGDLIYTGTPSGVGPIVGGDRIEATASGIGTMHVAVRAFRP